MERDASKDDMLLAKSEAWTPQRARGSKLEDARSAIFHLRHNKGLSYTAIKHFLAGEGVETSTAALSSFCRSRFKPGETEGVKASVLSRLAALKPKDGSK